MCPITIQNMISLAVTLGTVGTAYLLQRFSEGGPFFTEAAEHPLHLASVFLQLFQSALQTVDLALEFLLFLLQLLGAALSLYSSLLLLLQALGNDRPLTSAKWSPNVHALGSYLYQRLTSFSELFCFSSSDILSPASSLFLSRFWLCSVSVWFSFLLSERESRILSRRSYGHIYYIYITLLSDIWNWSDVEIGLSQNFSIAVLKILLIAPQQTQNISYTFYRNGPILSSQSRFTIRKLCFCLLNIFPSVL